MTGALGVTASLPAWAGECPDLACPSLLLLGMGAVHTCPDEKFKLLADQSMDVQLQGLVVCPVSLTARCWRSDFSLVWLNFVTYKLGIMLPYLWRVLWSSAVIVPTLQNSITMIMNFPFLLGRFDLNRLMLWMHLCIFLCSSTPIFPHQVAGEERSRWELWSPLRWCPWAPISPLPAVGGRAYGWWWAGSQCTD